MSKVSNENVMLRHNSVASAVAALCFEARKPGDVTQAQQRTIDGRGAAVKAGIDASTISAPCRPAPSLSR
jgi:hypothetical protein